MLTPPVLNESFWPVLSEVKSKGMAVFFARKFDNNQTRSLQDRIDAAVDRRSTDFGSGPRWLAVKGASSRAWLKALFHADALASPERLEVWEQQPRDGVYFGLQRYRASATVPCTDLLQESRLARRRCSATGQAVLEELAFRPIEDAMNLSAVSRSPLLAALRVGTGWSPEHFSLHMASVVLLEDLSQVDLVLYWSHATVRGGNGGDSTGEGLQQLEVLWKSPLGRTASSVSPFRPQLISWSRLPEGLAEMKAAGEWLVEVWLHGARIGSRSFFVCTERCRGLDPGTVRQYFAMT